ncbi:MAG: hypothetical protein H6828_08400 [Planctomycetes bacterium]|nr:hypothetical protein [Planctomycetota bacterium]
MRFTTSASALLVLAGSVLAQGGPPPPPPPLGNPITADKALLGKALFFDEQLSSTRLTACATCHINGAGGGDPRSLGNAASRNPGPDGLLGTPDDVVGSLGVVESNADGSYRSTTFFGLAQQVTTRQAPTMINAAFFPNAMFWDGRADGVFEDPLTGVVLLNGGAALESQAAGPPTSTAEMGHVGRDWSDVAARVAAAKPLDLASNLPADLSAFVSGKSYPQLFQQAFGTADVTPARIAMAIATYERTLLAFQTPFDAFQQGAPGALTPQQLLGQQIFTGPGRCIVCHGGPVQSDGLFHYIGVRPQTDDLGRFNVTNNPADRGAFKTPTLRNVELTAPYFHNGRFDTLEQVVDFYDRGGDFTAPNKPPAIAPIGLTAVEKAALVAFLRAFTDERVRNELPPFDRPTLYGESTRVPQLYGAGTHGTNGFVPRMVALEPPRIGNANLTLGVEGGFGNHQAILAVSPNADAAGTLFQGATLYIGLTGGVQLHRIAHMEGTGPGNGFDSVNLSLPLDPNLIGSRLFAQWFVFDLGAPVRFSASEAAAIEIF